MGQMTVEQWYGTIKTGLTKKLTENKEALPAGFNQQRFILNTLVLDLPILSAKSLIDQPRSIRPFLTSLPQSVILPCIMLFLLSDGFLHM